VMMRNNPTVVSVGSCKRSFSNLLYLTGCPTRRAIQRNKAMKRCERPRDMQTSTLMIIGGSSSTKLGAFGGKADRSILWLRHYGLSESKETYHNSFST